MARRLESLFVRYRRRGDVAALGKVFDQAAPEILRVAMHFARHPVEAEDLLQDTFLTAIARAETYDADRPLTPWLIGILKNHARKLGRRRRRDAGTAADVESALVADEPWMDVTWSDEVAGAVEALPDPYRQVLVLRLRHDKSPAEIAVLLDLPPATIRSQLHRGLERLRRRLPPDACVLAALPVGVGLQGIRETVLASATQAAVVSSTATATLLTGGLVMTKNTMIAAGALVAVLLFGGVAWFGGVFDADDEKENDRALAQTASDADRGADAADGPSATLVGNRDSIDGDPAPISAPSEGSADDGEGVWPPKREIPADKGSVAGTITFEDGTPVAGVTVALWGSSAIAAETDAQGRYHIHADWVHARSVYLWLGRDDQPEYLGLILSTDVKMRNGELVLRDIRVKRGLDLKARVVDARTREPIEGASVVLRCQPLRQGQASSGFYRTGADGSFHFPYVPRGVYTVELACEGYEGSVEAFDLTYGRLPTELTLLASRPFVIQFENLPPSAIGTTVSVDLSRMDQTAFSVMTDATVARDGTLRVDAPEAGRYRLTLFRSSHLPRLERDVEIPEGRLEPLVWRLPSGAHVVGSLRDAEDEPIVDAQVSIGGAAGSPKTDDEGAFAFSYVPTGERTVKVHVGTAWLNIGRVTVGSSGTVRADLRAAGSCALTGRFLVGGTPVMWTEGGLKIRDLNADREIATARPDKTGGFRVPLLPAGTYEIHAWCSRGAPKKVQVVVANGDVKDVGAIDLVAFERVPVRFVLPNGGTVPDQISVQAFDPAELPKRVPAFALSDGEKLWMAPYLTREADGVAWVERLTRGRVRIEFVAEGFETAAIDVEVRRGMSEPIAVQLEAK